MERFIHSENLKLWRKQLEGTTDQRKRAVLIDMIEKEEAREAELDASDRRKTGEKSERNSDPQLGIRNDPDHNWRS